MVYTWQQILALKESFSSSNVIEAALCPTQTCSNTKKTPHCVSEIKHVKCKSYPVLSLEWTKATLLPSSPAENGGKNNHKLELDFFISSCGRRGGLMVSALDSGASGPGPSPGRGHCVVFLGKTLLSQCLSPPRCIKRVPANCWGNLTKKGEWPAMD